MQSLRVEGNPVLAGALGEIERGVGGAEQGIGVPTVLGENRGADADGHLDAAFPEVEGCAAGIEQALRHGRGLGGVDQVGGDQGELVAAETGDRVRAAHRGHDPLGELAQQEIAGGVTEGVVDLLEAVDVEHHDGGPGAVARRARQRLLDAVDHQQTVRQVGQRVVGEQMADAVFRPAAVGNLAQQCRVGRAQLHGPSGNRGFEPLPGIIQPVDQRGVLQVELRCVPQRAMDLPADGGEARSIEQRDARHRA